MISHLASHFIGFIPVSTARRIMQKHSGTHGKHRSPHELNQILVDVSVISRKDAGTGIQRVVRSILKLLLNDPPKGYQIRPVAATRKRGYHYIDYIPGDSKNILTVLSDSKVSVATGDIFLGLDLAANILPLRHTELMCWKQHGAKLHFLVYDLLPVLHPHWFNPKTTSNIRNWLETIAVFADSLVCISKVVQEDLQKWMNKHYGSVAGKIPISTIPLGSDIEASAPTRGLSNDDLRLLVLLKETTTVLMVGTLEPRKGHHQVITAFDKLWLDNADINLVIVGKAGWKTVELQEKLNQHVNKNVRLYWLTEASDEMVQNLYYACRGVIVASEAEGFGLPLLEAMHYGTPVLARDIPVFREIAGDSASFFSSDLLPDLLAERILDWIQKIPSLRRHYKVLNNDTSWKESCDQLLHTLIEGNNKC